MKGIANPSQALIALSLLCIYVLPAATPYVGSTLPCCRTGSRSTVATVAALLLFDVLSLADLIPVLIKEESRVLVTELPFAVVSWGLPPVPDDIMRAARASGFRHADTELLSPKGIVICSK